MTSAQRWPRFGTVYILTVLALCVFRVSPGQAADARPDLSRKQNQQQRVRANTDHLVRRIGTMLRVLDYYQLDQGAEKRLLDEVAGTLDGLSQEQMAEVIARLEAAMKTTDDNKAQQEVDQAYRRHRDILASLRTLLARFDAIKNLDQAAERFDKAGKDQLELHLHTNQLFEEWHHALNWQAKQNTANEMQQEADDQSDLGQDVASVLAQLQKLRGKLPAGQQQRLEQAEAFATKQHVMDNLARAAQHLRQTSQPDPNWTKAADLQRHSAADLRELARILRTPSSRLNTLREVRQRIDLAIRQQDALRQETQMQRDPRVQDALRQSDAALRRAQELGAKQGRIEHATRGAQNLLRPHAPALAQQITPAENAMRQAERHLRNNQPANAVQPQAQAADTLRQVRRDLDRLIAAAEKQQHDPLVALHKASQALDQLIKEQKDLRKKTGEADRAQRSERLPPMAGRQHDLAIQTRHLQQQPMASQPGTLAALEQAATAMAKAAKSLASKHGPEALVRQDRAIQALEKAKKELDAQTAKIRKRRNDIAALADAAAKLGQMAKKESNIAGRAQDTAKLGSDQVKAADVTKDLSQQQNELTPQARQVGKQIEQAAPEAAKKVAEGAKHMQAAKGELAKSRLSPAAKQAGKAANILRQAQQAIAQALDKKRNAEIADQAAMQPGQVDPENAARQLAKAIEQARQAAHHSAQAQKDLFKATHALARSQEANQASAAALAQAQAQAPEDVQPLLQQAGQHLRQADQQLSRQEPRPAHQSQVQAVAQMGQALKKLNAVLAAMPKPTAQAGQQLSAMAHGAQPAQVTGQKPGQGQKPNRAQAKVPGQGPKRSPGAERRGKGTGNRLANAQLRQALSNLKDVTGDGSFLHLPPRQRELIKQALSEKLPPEYAALIQQYYVNIARGKPAAKPAAPTKP